MMQGHAELYDSPVEVMLDSHHLAVPQQAAMAGTKRSKQGVEISAPRMYLPYEVSPSELRYLETQQQAADSATKSTKRVRGMWGKMFGNNAAATSHHHSNSAASIQGVSVR